MDNFTSFLSSSSNTAILKCLLIASSSGQAAVHTVLRGGDRELSRLLLSAHYTAESHCAAVCDLRKWLHALISGTLRTLFSCGEPSQFAAIPYSSSLCITEKLGECTIYVLT